MSSDFKSPNSQPHMEALNVMRHAPRMIAGIIDHLIFVFVSIDAVILKR